MSRMQERSRTPTSEVKFSGESAFKVPCGTNMARASADANLGVSSGIERCHENDDVSTNVVVAPLHAATPAFACLLVCLAANLIELHMRYSNLNADTMKHEDRKFGTSLHDYENFDSIM